MAEVDLVVIFTLQGIADDPLTRGGHITAMLGAWFQSSLNPTWSELVEALRSSMIDRPDIADEIEDAYIKSDDSSVQESKDTSGECHVSSGPNRLCIILTWREKQGLGSQTS